jgi:hypothetical protein
MTICAVAITGLVLVASATLYAFSPKFMESANTVAESIVLEMKKGGQKVWQREYAIQQLLKNMSTTADSGRMPKLPKDCLKSTNCKSFIIITGVFLAAVGLGMATNGANGQLEGNSDYQTPVPSPISTPTQTLTPTQISTPTSTSTPTQTSIPTSTPASSIRRIFPQ